MSDHKTCSKCKQSLPVNEFYRDASRRDGLANKCRACQNARGKIYMKEYVRRESSRELHRAANQRHNSKPYVKAKRREYERVRRKNPEHLIKEKAYSAVRSAVRSGELERPENCSDCGIECIPHGHHEDYLKQLDVEWLCRICHGKRHWA